MNRSLYLSSVKFIRFQMHVNAYKHLKTFFHLNFNMLSHGWDKRNSEYVDKLCARRENRQFILHKY